MSKTLFVLLVIGLAFVPLSSASAISPDAFQKLQFEIEHSGSDEVRKAGEVLTSHGILKPDGRSAKSRKTSSVSTDCHVQFNHKFISNILDQDMVGKKLPDGLIELHTLLNDSNIAINGRLDGPAFINPKFSAEVDLGFVAANNFKVRVSSIRLAGFKASLFTRMISGYIEDALKRAFPKSCQTKITTKSGGIIDIDVKVDPEGFVPGVSSYGYLSNAGIRDGRMFFSFSIPTKKKRRR